MSHIYNIVDAYGDTLTVEPGQYPANSGNLYVEIKQDNCNTAVELVPNAVVELRDSLDEFLGDVEDAEETSYPTANEAKLRLAAQYGCRVKFAYAGERDYRAVERRLEPEVVDTQAGVSYVEGESYDAGGQAQGYRRFRLDRISGEVVVR